MPEYAEGFLPLGANGTDRLACGLTRVLGAVHDAPTAGAAPRQLALEPHGFLFYADPRDGTPGILLQDAREQPLPSIHLELAGADILAWHAALDPLCPVPSAAAGSHDLAMEPPADVPAAIRPPVSPETFKMPVREVVTLWVGAIFFALLAVVCVWWVLIERAEQVGMPTSEVVMRSGLMGLLFVTLGVFATWTVQSLVRVPDAAISVDKDGLWRAREGKYSGLVRWSDIAGFKESLVMQRLTLLGRDGSRLLDIEYQLAGAGRLRGIVAGHACGSTGSAQGPVTFRKPLGYHVIMAIDALIAPGVLLVLQRFEPMSGAKLAFFVVIGVALEVMVTIAYAAMPTGVTIERDALTVTRPLSSRRYPFADVEDIVCGDLFTLDSYTHPYPYQNRVPVVQVVLHGDADTVVLRDMGVASLTIYQALSPAWKAWRDKARPRPTPNPSRPAGS